MEELTIHQPPIETRVLKKRKVSTKKILVSLFLLVFCATAVSAGYFYWQYRSLTASQRAASKEVADVVKSVGKLMDLPKDETPTLATVTDVDKIKSQPFFARAQNGDKVLIYVKLGKAIMYRPSVKKIIDITDIKTTQTAASGSAEQNSAELGTSDQKK